MRRGRKFINKDRLHEYVRLYLGWVKVIILNQNNNKYNNLR